MPESMRIAAHVLTKVPISIRGKISAIADRFSLTFYGLLQAVLKSFTHYLDSDITDEHATILDAFGYMLMSQRDSFNPLALKGKTIERIDKAIIFDSGSSRPQVLAIAKDSEGRTTESYNLDAMLADYLRATDPALLRALKAEKMRQHDFSLSKTLRRLVMQRRTPQADQIREDVKSLFEDVRIDSGQRINEGVFYRHKHNRGDYIVLTPTNPTLHADL